MSDWWVADDPPLTDTAAGWVSANPTTVAGTSYYETDTGRTKRGDGTSRLNDVAYVGAPAMVASVVAIPAVDGGVT